MTRNKDLKKVVRARMHKTGESYTAARAVVTLRKDSPAGKANYAAPRAQWPELAGIRDEAVKEKTGRTWAQWVKVLEGDGARAWTHRDIAKHIRETYPDVSGWWSQTITVGFERICGLREVGQSCDGVYEANKSRTFPVDVATLYAMFHDTRRRKMWLPTGITKIRTATEPKSIRADWHDGTQVNFYFTPKGEGKSVVSIQHTKLAGKADIEKAKAEWGNRLDALKQAL